MGRSIRRGSPQPWLVVFGAGFLLGAAFLAPAPAQGQADGPDPSRILLPRGVYGDIYSLKWRAGGKELAFYAVRKGQQDYSVFLYDREGGGVREVVVPGLPALVFANWLSSDGNEIVCRACRDRDKETWLAKIELPSGKSQKLYVLENPWLVQMSSLSPDGRWVVAADLNQSPAPGYSRLSLVSTSGNTEPKSIWGGQPGYQVTGPPSWSADSKSLAWWGCETGGEYVSYSYYVAQNLPDVQRIVVRKVDAGVGKLGVFGAWSPRRSEFVYVLAPPTTKTGNASEGPSGLRIWDCETWKSRSLTTLPLSAEVFGFAGVVWSPDGSRIAYVVSLPAGDAKSGHAELWIVDADGKNNRRVAAREYAPFAYGADCWFALTWRSDGKALDFVRNDSIMEIDVP